jgi:hypothetical protein
MPSSDKRGRRNRSDGDTPLGFVQRDVAEQVSHHGTGMTVIDWRSVDFVVSGALL